MIEEFPKEGGEKLLSARISITLDKNILLTIILSIHSKRGINYFDSGVWLFSENPSHCTAEERSTDIVKHYVLEKSFHIE